MDGQTATADWITPWFMIWISPRATIRRIVDVDPDRFVLGIAWIAGALAALNLEVSNQRTSAGTASMTSWLASLGPLELAAFAFMLGVTGVVMLYVLGALYRRSGSILGGTAQMIEVRSAIAWAQVPAIYLTVLGVIVAIATPAVPSIQPGQPPSFSLWMFLRIVLGIWAFVISLKMLGEVHHFSAWRGFGAMLIGNFVFGLAMAAVVIAIVVGSHLV